MEIRKELLELSEQKYQLFQKTLIPNQENILGVRIPKLRALAKKFQKATGKIFY